MPDINPLASPLSLADLTLGENGCITGFNAPNEDAEIRLREVGFAEGDIICITHIGLLGRSPYNVKLHGTSIAMRPQEAAMIFVTRLSST